MSGDRQGRGGAHRADPRVIIRDLSTLDDMRACVRLQQATWGKDFTEKVPLSILKVGQRLGGVSAGAFLTDGSAEGELVGFVFGLTGLTPDGPAHWSDMLAVSPEYRGRGIGIRLKLFQRERVLDLDVRTMFWTFDPLEVRNGRLNFRRLGGYSVEYVPDMYGASVSPLHLGLATDRLVVRWDLDSRRVAEALTAESGGPVDLSEAVTAFDVTMDGQWPVPADALRPMPPEGDYLIPVPSGIAALHAARPDLARRWRKVGRAALQEALREGGAVIDAIPGESLSHYRVVPRRSIQEHP